MNVRVSVMPPVVKLNAKKNAKVVNAKGKGKGKVDAKVVNVKAKGKGMEMVKHTPGQVIETKSGKRYIVDQNRRYIPISKKNARRDQSREVGKSESASAPRAGSIQMINGQTYVVGEDRRTFIPITPSAAAGQGVLTTLLEVAAVILIADLIIDLIVDDIAFDDLAYTPSFGVDNVWNSGGFF